MAPLVKPVREWYCPECGFTDTTNDAVLTTHYHICPRLRFLAVGLVPVGTKARIVLKEREDYVGNENVQLDPERQRPVMSIITLRDDGSNDTVVLAPSATGTGRV